MFEITFTDITLHFGRISIRLQDERYFLVQEDGEAMEVGEVELERLLQDYYEGNF